MYTLNEILTIIETQANAHLQVKQYGQGDVWEINPKELDYLVLWAIEESVVLSERTLTYNIRLLAMDRVLTGRRERARSDERHHTSSTGLRGILSTIAHDRFKHPTERNA
jgi:hypothetical protein